MSSKRRRTDVAVARRRKPKYAHGRRSKRSLRMRSKPQGMGNPYTNIRTRNYRTRPTRASAGLLTSIPNRMFTKVKYHSTLGIEQTTSGTTTDTFKNPSQFINDSYAAGTGNFRLMDLWDPDCRVASGHQPMGHDRLALYYNRYIVYAVKVTIHVTNVGISDRIGFDFYPVPIASATAPALNATSVTTLMEQGYRGWKRVSGGGTEQQAVAPKSAGVTFRRFYNLRKIMGRPLEDDLDSSAFGSTVQDYPRLDCLYRIPGWTNQIGDSYKNVFTATVSRAFIEMGLTYYIKAYEPKIVLPQN